MQSPPKIRLLVDTCCPVQVYTHACTFCRKWSNLERASHAVLWGSYRYPIIAIPFAHLMILYIQLFYVLYTNKKFILFWIYKYFFLSIIFSRKQVIKQTLLCILIKSQVISEDVFQWLLCCIVSEKNTRTSFTKN